MDDLTQPQTGLPIIETPIDVVSEVTDTEVSESIPEMLNTESNPQETTTQTIEEQPQNNDLSTIDAQLPIEELSTKPNCDYCTNKEKYQTLIDDYISKSFAKTGDKVAIPFVEELLLILNIEIDTFNTWVTDETHKELITSIKRLVLLQRVRLLQRAAGRFDPKGAIFLLRKLHDL